ncbi:uncharacterized protein LOC110700234 [Chenopodium quinoa]|uniref:uncharacterized protein LOC110700234 n=1 Tax=Chenopodium quinoa TaxID=63459 RepID=UPI000B77A201|nr:uncharacterized protein LOC110700234 [Chenopodium quinoa]
MFNLVADLSSRFTISFIYPQINHQPTLYLLFESSDGDGGGDGGGYSIENVKRAKLNSTLAALLDDPILADVPKKPSLSDVHTLITLELGSAMRITILKLDSTSFDIKSQALFQTPEDPTTSAGCVNSSCGLKRSRLLLTRQVGLLIHLKLPVFNF